MIESAWSSRALFLRSFSQPIACRSGSVDHVDDRHDPGRRRSGEGEPSGMAEQPGDVIRW